MILRVSGLGSTDGFVIRSGIQRFTVLRSVGSRPETGCDGDDQLRKNHAPWARHELFAGSWLFAFTMPNSAPGTNINAKGTKNNLVSAMIETNGWTRNQIGTMAQKNARKLSGHWWNENIAMNGSMPMVANNW